MPIRASGSVRAYLLLAFTALCWGGNAVAGRLAVGEMSPMIVVTMRWLLVCAALLALVRGQFAVDLPALRRRWRFVVVMGATGFTGFNALFYVAAHHTTGVNIAILQGSIPVVVLIGGFLAYRTAVGPWQVLGTMVTLAGVVVVATFGEPGRILQLSFNAGDLLVLVACVLYAGYTLGLRARPPVSGHSLFAAMAAVAFLTSLPLLAGEAITGQLQWPTPKGWLILAFIALLPSLLAQLSFMRAVELIGPGRAGLFVNLVPIFGALLSVLILGEAFRGYHAIALALVLGGIFVAEQGSRNTRQRADA